MLQAKVTVRLKQEVSDSEGHAVRDALNTLHQGFCGRVRVGKVFFINLTETDPGKARQAVEKVSEEILSNPVIEMYEIEIVEVEQ